jgi:iron-sulfur cluster assembly protein
MTTTAAPTAHTVQITENAARIVREAFAAEKVNPAEAYVRVGAKPGGCSGYRYTMDFADAKSVTGADVVFESLGIKVVVDKTCLADVLGSVEIDYDSANIVEQGFKFRPIGNVHTCGCGESFEPVKAKAS